MTEPGATSRTTVITGASAGIGAALARELAREGHRLALGARRGGLLRDVARECEALGSPAALAVEVDVTRRGDVLHLRDEALRAFGRIDVWVNNAGRGITRPVLELTDEDLDEMIAVNVKSALYGMQAVLPHFRAHGSGHLLNVSSVLGRVPRASFRSAYSAAKAALNSLTANLRMDLNDCPGVHVTLVLPGVVSTGFARNVVGEPRPPMSGSVAQSAEEAARSIASAIREPVAELYTNPAHEAATREYFADVAGFEARFEAGGA